MKFLATFLLIISLLSTKAFSKETHGICEWFEPHAETIMQKRQSGVSKEELIHSYTDSSDRDLLEAIIAMAYKHDIYITEKEKTKAVNEFIEEVSLTCSATLRTGENQVHPPDELYYYKGSSIISGKTISFELKEIERQSVYSIISVKLLSGSTELPMTFLLTKYYEIAKLRGFNFLTQLKEWRDDEGSWVYKIGFTNDDKVDPYKYFGDNIDSNKDIVIMPTDLIETMLLSQ